jgi:hypothetical protein
MIFIKDVTQIFLNCELEYHLILLAYHCEYVTPALLNIIT